MLRRVRFDVSPLVTTLLWDRIQVKLKLTGKSCLTFYFYPINLNRRTNMKTSKRGYDTMSSKTKIATLVSAR